MDNSKILTALVLGDVCGKPGSRALFMGLSALKKEFRADIVILNGENAANGFGLNDEQLRQFFDLGVDVVTSGNHIWQQETLRPTLDNEPRLLRPANYAPGVPGHGSVVVEVAGHKVGVLNLQGRTFLPPLDCPFRVGVEMLEKLSRQTPVIIVDFHAEAPHEKEAFAFHVDGKVSLVVGTHTHVQTADERILPGGTAYISDIGMCGPRDSVIGSDPTLSIERQLTQMPLKSEILDAPGWIQGVCCSIDVRTGKAVKLERIARSYGG
ncbi:TIGR00282 family metallophosphoesterase [Parasphaerochaeta coccoides]|uniref:Metallophosphoesterase n=1 Tax=Parasphaerochaeta coccoides (strain ATCC BAA-1237 / DSM 17374 / SPN1) TaxID=760011 RepID=F4GKK3_PARC1|nr:TIGR00282 family metallophosphoesterase [Parasphaerochaeta coccoides]AEC02886.1 Conserved hypothetical protein CHP00282 [Parasphaerochaeta coccoides DSM 17374]